MVEKKSVDPVIKAKSEVLTTIGDLEQVNIFFLSPSHTRTRAPQNTHSHTHTHTHTHPHTHVCMQSTRADKTKQNKTKKTKKTVDGEELSIRAA